MLKKIMNVQTPARWVLIYQFLMEGRQKDLFITFSISMLKSTLSSLKVFPL